MYGNWSQRARNQHGQYIIILMSAHCMKLQDIFIILSISNCFLNKAQCFVWKINVFCLYSGVKLCCINLLQLLIWWNCNRKNIVIPNISLDQSTLMWFQNVFSSISCSISTSKSDFHHCMLVFRVHSLSRIEWSFVHSLSFLGGFYWISFN